MIAAPNHVWLTHNFTNCSDQFVKAWSHHKLFTIPCCRALLSVMLYFAYLSALVSYKQTLYILFPLKIPAGTNCSRTTIKATIVHTLLVQRLLGNQSSHALPVSCESWYFFLLYNFSDIWTLARTTDRSPRSPRSCFVWWLFCLLSRCFFDGEGMGKKKNILCLSWNQGCSGTTRFRNHNPAELWFTIGQIVISDHRGQPANRQLNRLLCCNIQFLTHPCTFGTKEGSFKSSRSGEHRKNIYSLTTVMQHLPLTNLMHILCVMIKCYMWSYCVKYRLWIHRTEPLRSSHTGVTLGTSGLTFTGSSHCDWEGRKEVWTKLDCWPKAANVAPLCDV